MKSLFVQMQNLYSDRKGITGLETAIILIAFIVVAAVFAFTVMTTGLFSTEKAKTTAQAGIAEASSTFAPKGAIVATRDPAAPTRVQNIFVQLQPATGATGSSINAADLAFIYVDQNQRYATDGGMTTGTEGIIEDINITKIVGDRALPNLLQEGEVAEIQFTLRPEPNPQANPVVITNLGSNTTFTIEIIPSTGGSLIINRKPPPELVDVMNLQ